MAEKARLDEEKSSFYVQRESDIRRLKVEAENLEQKLEEIRFIYLFIYSILYVILYILFINFIYF